MKNRLDARPQERHHIRTPLFARRQYAPKPFQPAIAPIAPSIAVLLNRNRKTIQACLKTYRDGGLKAVYQYKKHKNG